MRRNRPDKWRAAELAERAWAVCERLTDVALDEARPWPERLRAADQQNFLKVWVPPTDAMHEGDNDAA